MSTNDVPGSNPQNGDKLSIGNWAEAEDGSLVLVEGNENNRVIFSVFDTSVTPVMEYRDSMSLPEFERYFSIRPTGQSSIKWTWHDKTLFPWDSVIKQGSRPGSRMASADDAVEQAGLITRSRERVRAVRKRASDAISRARGRTAAQTVAEDLKMQGRTLGDDEESRRS